MLNIGKLPITLLVLASVGPVVRAAGIFETCENLVITDQLSATKGSGYIKGDCWNDAHTLLRPTALDLNFCVRNIDAELFGQDHGGAMASCSDCVLNTEYYGMDWVESVELECRCKRDTQLSPFVIGNVYLNLSPIIFNLDGHFSCYGNIGT